MMPLTSFLTIQKMALNVSILEHHFVWNHQKVLAVEDCGIRGSLHQNCGRLKMQCCLPFKVHGMNLNAM